ncbi:MAG: hypothetical protein RMM06_09225 [Armatimonadota bacterium]|nr:hypothetical protein [Armatimonadota bacterium]MDW8290894.1 hypothetical protein [Armatimonadota bacterium]
MSKTVTIEVPDDLYEVFTLVAHSSGKRIEEVVLDFYAQTAPRPRNQRSAEEEEEARRRFERHFGEVSLGYPTGADNESIDADLAAQYGSSHEGNL